MRRWLGILPVMCAVVLLAAAAPSAHADGCYFPERAVATPPAIPAPRALLVWDEAAKRETLVIESSLDAKSQRLGWILPLPAEPDSVREASPGLLKTLDACFQPEIKYRFNLNVWVAWGILPAVWIVCLFVCFFRRRRAAKMNFLFLMLAIFLSLLLFPHLREFGSRSSNMATIGLGVGGGYAVSGVEVRQSMMVGHYEIAVLKADSAAALDKWLALNELAALPGQGRNIVESYIRDGWRFVAVRLQLAEKGVQTPHPLAVTFPAKEAVYPMRLTALSGQPMWLDLFVAGPKRALAPVLKTWFSDTLRATPAWASADMAHTSILSARDVAGGVCGHPEFLRMVSAGIVFTRLSGTVTPRQMDQDFVMVWKMASACRATLYSVSLVRKFSILLVGGAASLFLLVLGVGRVKEDWLWQAGGGWKYFRRILLPGFACILVAGLLLRLCLPTAHMGVVFGRAEWLQESEARGAVEELPNGAGVAELRAKYLERFSWQEFRSRPIEEASPGNYTVGLSADGRPQITVYDRHGCPAMFTAPKHETDGKRETGGEK